MLRFRSGYVVLNTADGPTNVPALAVDGEGKSGHRFTDAAFVLEPRSDDPCLRFLHPISLAAVRELIEALDNKHTPTAAWTKGVLAVLD